MTAGMQRALQYAHQLEAARELVALVQRGMLLDLPVLAWHIADTGCSISAEPDPNLPADARVAAVHAWADALEAPITGASTLATRQGRAGAVKLVIGV